MTMKAILRFPATLLLATTVFFPLAAAPLYAQQAAKPTAVDPASFDVIGISVRTTNAAEATSDGEIPKLWQRLFMEGILSAIPDRADDGIVAVYTNYASDQDGEYTYIVGSKVKAGTKAPDGMTAITVPAGKYLEFVTEKGPGAEVVPAAWRQIYGYFQSPSNPVRLFKTDYELYGEMTDPNAMQGHIFIGIK